MTEGEILQVTRWHTWIHRAQGETHYYYSWSCQKPCGNGILICIYSRLLTTSPSL